MIVDGDPMDGPAWATMPVEFLDLLSRRVAVEVEAIGTSVARDVAACRAAEPMRGEPHAGSSSVRDYVNARVWMAASHPFGGLCVLFSRAPMLVAASLDETCHLEFAAFYVSTQDVRKAARAALAKAVMTWLEKSALDVSKARSQ